ncbi:trafficking protein particle complex subunit 3 [Heterostelium album PN500]|uniref:Trafficking protein particle complex subunit 3 n=1 Tax=Heterostelium pallidum (strain ATCC 26659 / Pp 5 / PN500) TaxID=670386 RepID=D3BKU3_HETP5|nr:trafficking protein particle complex subunit 3 [Heterostelium album PN500]EFA78523.1 trafficking protein particle complex subunit 3 [Heterostelium album PN500]|eukprot:XP_020430647.1 trafficking protein particle complex subunit 3 [Heterostelium album PN500]
MSSKLGFGAIFNSFFESYKSRTPQKLKIIDLFLVYAFLTGVIVFAYCCLVGTFPFNSFLAAFISCVGTFILTGIKMSKKYDKLGDIVFSKVDKINAELFTLTYGALVTQLIKDYEDIDQVNIKLEQMGYNIGVRLIEEFLAKSNIGRCSGFQETAEVIAKVGFKMFLGVTCQISDWDAEKKEFHLIIEDNPLIDFVELPEHLKHKLYYSNILCGVIRGALEMVQMKVKCTFVKCALSDESASEIKVVLEEVLSDMAPVGYD